MKPPTVLPIWVGPGGGGGGDSCKEGMQAKPCSENARLYLVTASGWRKVPFDIQQACGQATGRRPPLQASNANAGVCAVDSLTVPPACRRPRGRPASTHGACPPTASSRAAARAQRRRVGAIVIANSAFSLTTKENE